jgi:hypothetical protein
MLELTTIVLVILVAIAIGALLIDAKRSKTKRKANAGIGDSANQLRLVTAAQFHKQAVLNREEYGVFRTIEAHLASAHRGYRVNAQMSLGEIISSPDEKAYRCINAKRADMVVFDRSGFAVAAVEYQGGLHHQGDAAVRDAVKKEALRRAGVEFVEFFQHNDDAEIRRQISAAIARVAAAAQRRAASETNNVTQLRRI